MTNMLKNGLSIIKQNIKKSPTKYLGDQEVLSLSLKEFKNISKGLFDLPLFTVGIPSEKKINTLCIVHPIHCDKEFSLKERLLYYVNENNYYTSKSLRYIIFSRYILENNITEAIDICKKYNLILILPDQKCRMPECMYEMDNSFGDKKLITILKSSGIKIRESISFLLNVEKL